MTYRALKLVIFGMTRGHGEVLFEWSRDRIWSKKNERYSHIHVSQGIARGVKISPRLPPPR